jgi:uncharacterized SAM-binding protein YcdF (DUF218 family)
VTGEGRYFPPMIVTPSVSRARRVRSVLGALGLALALGWTVSLAGVLWHAARDRALPADAIVVLGAAHYLGRPSPVLRARLDQAAALHRRGVAPLVVLTGGTAPGDTTSEAAVGYAYLRRRGIPAEALLMEQQGRTTRESLAAVRVLLADRGVSRVVLVSDPFHLFRARLVAARLGLHAVTSPARGDDETLGALVRRHPVYLLSESVKAPIAWLTGR